MWAALSQKESVGTCAQEGQGPLACARAQGGQQGIQLEKVVDLGLRPPGAVSGEATLTPTYTTC